MGCGCSKSLKRNSVTSNVNSTDVSHPEKINKDSSNLKTELLSDKNENSI